MTLTHGSLFFGKPFSFDTRQYPSDTFLIDYLNQIYLYESLRQILQQIASIISKVKKFDRNLLHKIMIDNQQQLASNTPEQPQPSQVTIQIQPQPLPHPASQGTNIKRDKQIEVIELSDDEKGEDWEAVQQDYERLFCKNPFNKNNPSSSKNQKKVQGKKNNWKSVVQNQTPAPRVYPIDHYALNHLIPIGNKRGRLLCKVREVWIDADPEVKEKQARVNAIQNPKKSKGNSLKNDYVFEQLVRKQIQDLFQDEYNKKFQQTQLPNHSLQRFYQKRYYLFSNFDDGIKLDYQSWFSVTPEAVAGHIAGLFSGSDTVLDGFCGAGGDSIQIAKRCKKVVANDIDPQKMALLKHNASICGVLEKIQIKNQDFLELQYSNTDKIPQDHQERLQREQILSQNEKLTKLDCVYLSPPWGGPEYYEKPSLSPDELSPPLSKIIEKSLGMSDNLAMLLPINIDVGAVAEYLFEKSKLQVSRQKSSSFRCSFCIQKIYFLGRLKFILVLFGQKVAKIDISEQLSYLYQMVSQDESDLTSHKALIKLLIDKLGSPLVLNLLFECEGVSVSRRRSFSDNFKDLLIRKKLITAEELQRIGEIEQEEEAKKCSKKDAMLSKKERKRGQKEQESSDIQDEQSQLQN